MTDAYVYVDYLTKDKNVVHLFPTQLRAAPRVIRDLTATLASVAADDTLHIKVGSGTAFDVDVTFSRTVSDVPGAIRQWGGRLTEGSEEEADALASRIERDVASLAGEPAGPPFLYAYWIWKDPWMTISDGTYVADMNQRLMLYRKVAAARDRLVDALNQVYADVKGNIGWMPSGLAPRRPNWDGLLPVPGDGRYEWAGMMPEKELPGLQATLRAGDFVANDNAADCR